MLLKKAKMNRPKFLPVRPPKPALCNPTHRRELTKISLRRKGAEMEELFTCPCFLSFFSRLETRRPAKRHFMARVTQQLLGLALSCV
jgi:hypothetical protein